MQNITTHDQPARTARDLIETIFRHKAKAITFFLAVLLATHVMLIFSPEEFTSTAKLMVRRGREGVLLVPSASGRNLFPLHKEWESEINTELEILGSHELVIEVARTFKEDLLKKNSVFLKKALPEPVQAALVPAYQWFLKGWQRITSPGRNRDGQQQNQTDLAAQLVEKKLLIEGPEMSDIITVSYTATNPELARQVVNQLVTTYMDRRIDVHRVPGAYQFFGQQTEQLIKELQDAEESISSVKNEAGISSLEDSHHSVMTSTETVQALQLENKTALAAANARVETLRMMLSKQGSATANENNNPSLDREERSELQAMLNNEELTQVALQSPATANEKNNPLLDREERAELQAILNNEAITQAALLAEANELEQQLTQLQRELAKINALTPALSELRREQEMLENKYRKYYEDKEQARINEELETRKISNVHIVQQATLPVKADPSGKNLKFFAALFMGLVGAIAIPFGADYLDPTLHSKADVDERLGLKTLLELPQLHRGELNGFMEDDSLKKSPKGWIGHRNETPIVVDYFQELLFKILSARAFGKGGPFVIGVTSSFVGEGVSSITANLAAAFARDDRFEDVLLLDASMQTHPEGLAVRMASAPFIYQQIRQMENDEDSETAGASSTLFAEQLNQVKRQRHNVILVDLPPVCPGGDAIRIAADLDFMVLVIQAEQTPWRDALRTVEFLTESKSNVCGVILNQKISVMPEWLDRKL